MARRDMKMVSELSLLDPFRNMRISSWEPLRNVQGRSPCPRCGKSRKFFCYSCYEVVDLNSHDIPHVQLPIKIDIVKHWKEVDGKSTATHAKILAPDRVTIYEFPTSVPCYPDISRVILLYPLEGAFTCKELAESFGLVITPTDDGQATVPQNHWDCLDTVVVIDSTWQQTHQILKHKHIKCLRAVKLTDAKTCFWRPQRKTEAHLATIEAIYYLLKELNPLLTSREYEGQYDDLLYFYSYLHMIVHTSGSRFE